LTSPPSAAEPQAPLESLKWAYPGRASSLADGGLVLLMAAAAFALGCQELSDADVWWHVRAGQWIWHNQKVPTLDPFTFGSADRPWIDLHWLFQVWLAAVFAAVGVRGMILMVSGVWTAVVLVGLTAGRRRWPVWVATACWLPALVVMSARFSPRPEVFSLLGVALYLAILARTDDTPQLAWTLPLIQVLWVNAQGLFVLGPVILIIYLADRLAGRIQGLTTDGSEERFGRYRWWAHVGGATVMVGLACLGNPYGLRGALLPLELLPKITAWGAQYKSYIIEFGDLQEFVRKQGVAATSGLYLRADCFLFWVVPLTFIMPAIWRTGRADISSRAWTKGCIGVFGLAVSLVLASVLGFPGPGAPAWLIWLGRLAPLGFVALGALSAPLVIRSSRRAALLVVMAGVTLAIWVLWLRVHLFGLEPGPGAWFGGSGSFVLGWGTVLIGGTTAVLIFRAGGRFFTMALAVTFGYLALQAIRNINLFGLVAGFVTTWNLGEWSATLAVETRAQEHRPTTFKVKGLIPRVVMAGLVGLLVFTIVSGWFFRSTGELRRLGLRERPLLYAHEAARFAGRPGLPDRALVFDLGQAAVYLFHNGPGRKIFMDGRLEIPRRETFQTYVRLENILNEGRHGWAEPVRRMGDPLILLDHEKEFGAEATILGDPDWRCIYYDAVASVFLSRRRGLETSFPSVDFVMRHFHDPLWQAIPPVPWGLAEAKGLLNLGLAVQYRDRLTGRLPLALRLLTCDRFRQAIALDPTIAEYWTSLGICCWNMVPSPLDSPPGPSAPWDIATGLLPAQAAFCFRRALELDPAQIVTLMPLYHAFDGRGMIDAQQRMGVLIDRASVAASLDGSSRFKAGVIQSNAELDREAKSLAQRNQGERDGLAHTVGELLEQGYPEAAVRLFTETQSRGIAADWPTSDRVATTLLHLGRPAEASQIWEHAVVPPSPALRQVRIATALLAALDFPAADRGYRAALELDPTLGEAWFGLAWLHTQRGDSAQAVAACQQGRRHVLTPAQTSFLQGLETLIEPLEPDR
jgi:tetratricopeptide (TPR) repeat protein